MIRLRRILIAFVAAFALLPAVAATATPPLHPKAGDTQNARWKILPQTKLPGFPYFEGPDSVAVSGSGGNAFVIGQTQLVKLNIHKSPASIIWRAANVYGSDIVMNPKHQAAYITASSGNALKVVNTFYAKKPKITKSFNYNCGPYCGITDVAVTRNAKYLLVGVSDYPDRVDIYSLATPTKPTKVGHYKMRLEPDAIATSPNGRYMIVQGIDQDNTSVNKYMVLDISKPKHVTIVKHRTELPFTDTGPIVPAPGGAHMYLVGQDTMDAVYVADVKPSGHWPITRRKKVMPSNGSFVTGADITTTGKYIYIARGGIPSDDTVCTIGFAHLSKATCFTDIDDPNAGVVLAKKGKTRDRAYFAEGQVNTHTAWLDVLGPPK